jgi:hypothetical protein
MMPAHGKRFRCWPTFQTVERIYADRRKIACLCADLRNPASNRYYTRVGFTPVCKSLHFHRETRVTIGEPPS